MGTTSASIGPRKGTRRERWPGGRCGIADLHRRAEVSRKAAERYLDAFASVDEETCGSPIFRPTDNPAFLDDSPRLVIRESAGLGQERMLQARSAPNLTFSCPAFSAEWCRQRLVMVLGRMRIQLKVGSFH